MLRRTYGALFALMLTAALALPASSGAVGELPAAVVAVDPPVSSAAYQTIDYGRKPTANDDRAGKTTWRVVKDTGNCCENFLTTTPGGRLLDFGGSHIYFSDDRGLTWKRVQPLTPLVNGEGAIVAAPGGDVLGVEWDPYSGDHLQFYKYEASTGQWHYTEMPLHQPFYDREWITVVPGPVTIAGQTHEYVSFVKGGVPKDVWFYSTDGLHYTQITSSDLDKLLSGGDVVGPLPTTAGADNDWVQPNTNGGAAALGGGEALASPDTIGTWSLLDGDTFTWSRFRFPDGSNPSGLYQVDSAGRVHNVVVKSDSASFDYRLSADGGQTWSTLTVALPTSHVVEEIDFRANLAAGVAAVAMRAENLGVGADQDLVYKFDITGAAARLLRLYEIGLGDLDATGGVGNDIRFDFETVTIFSDGRVAVSYLDSTTTGLSPTTGEEGLDPAIAIELDTKLRQKAQPEETVTPVLGERYASYSFDSGDEGWTSSGVGVWLRTPPGMKDGQDDLSTQSFGIEGPAYIDNMDAQLTSPPIDTVAGLTVLEFWTKLDIEEGFDDLRLEWSSDGTTWTPFSLLSGQNESYPGWDKVTRGFESPGGPIRVRFRFTSDQLCSGVDPACGRLFGGLRVDDVVLGKQAP